MVIPLPTPALAVDADFPGGNILVHRIEGNDLYLSQDPRDTSGWWFYWAFRVRGAAGRRLRVTFTDGKVVGVRGPAISLDGGLTWRWSDQEFTPESFAVSIPEGVAEARFAVSMVYTQANWERFLQRLGPSPFLRGDVLTRSHGGRDVECLHVGPQSPGPYGHILVLARNHCCEMMASYVMEGMIEAILTSVDGARPLCETARFLFVPFVDKDGVEAGDQGKNRRPRDHNRDYSGESVHAETAALRARLPGWCGGRLRAMFDLHCPCLRGPHNLAVYMVGREPPAAWAEQQRLAAILETVQSGALAYRSQDNLPFGQGWNTTRNYAEGRSSVRWAAEELLPPLATTFEVPYASANGQEVNGESARAFGTDVARALAGYLRQTTP
ncbi:MAG: peptidase M14 [Lentisphaeria bacterium]|nr:peptidase M14 [Lentisphaeria bacterium]